MGETEAESGGSLGVPNAEGKGAAAGGEVGEAEAEVGVDCGEAVRTVGSGRGMVQVAMR
jgi:hypothetical protein